MNKILDSKLNKELKIENERLCKELKFANEQIRMLKGALSLLSLKIAGVARYYSVWRCPNLTMYKKCPIKNKTDEQCAKFIEEHALQQAETWKEANTND